MAYYVDDIPSQTHQWVGGQHIMDIAADLRRKCRTLRVLSTCQELGLPEIQWCSCCLAAKALDQFDQAIWGKR